MYILKEIKSNKLGSIMFIISLFISSFCIAIALNMILNEANYTKEHNNFADNNKIINLTFNGKVEFDKLTAVGELIAQDRYQVNLPSVRFDIENKTGYVIGIINNYNDFNFVWGRNFTKAEFNNMEKKAVIGSNFLDKTYSINNKKYIDIFNETFEVIGAVGEKYGGKSFYDFNIYIPYKALPKEILTSKTDIAQMITNNKDFKLDENFKIKNNIFNGDIESINKINFRENVEKNYSEFLNYIRYLVVFVLCNTFLLTMSWIHNRKYKFAIKIVLGYSMKQNIKDLILEISILTLIANSLSAIIYNMLSSYISNLFFIKIGLSPMNFILGLIISLTICIIISLIELVILSKSNINSMMQS